MNNDERWEKILSEVNKVLPKDPYSLKRKYISRVDNDERKAHYWRLDIYIKNERYQKTFADKKLGGKASALLAAIAHRLKVVEENNLILDPSFKKQPFDSDAEGVYFYIKKWRHHEYPIFKCCWQEPIDGKQVRKAKTFSVNKYGYKRAKQKAIKFRNDKLKELYQ